MKEILEQKSMTGFMSGMALAFGILFLFAGEPYGAGIAVAVSAILWKESK